MLIDCDARTASMGKLNSKADVKDKKRQEDWEPLLYHSSHSLISPHVLVCRASENRTTLSQATPHIRLTRMRTWLANEEFYRLHSNPWLGNHNNKEEVLNRILAACRKKRNLNHAWKESLLQALNLSQSGICYTQMTQQAIQPTTVHLGILR
jgi:hypothetical protein